MKRQILLLGIAVFLSIGVTFTKTNKIYAGNQCTYLVNSGSIPADNQHYFINPVTLSVGQSFKVVATNVDRTEWVGVIVTQGLSGQYFSGIGTVTTSPISSLVPATFTIEIGGGAPMLPIKVSPRVFFEVYLTRECGH